jgi:HEAT repeats
MQRARTVVVILCLLPWLPGGSFAQVSKEPPVQAETLRQLGVTPTAEGIVAFLRSVARGNHTLPDADADALIVQLGNDEFERREKATQRLTALPFPPRAKLQAASKSTDLETATRARDILDRLDKRPDPLVVVLQAARERNLRLTPADLVALLPVCETESAVEAAQEDLLAGLGQDDLPQVRRWLEDRRPRVRAAGVRGLAVLLKDKALPELRKLLESPEEVVRVAAARALVQGGQAVDFDKYAAGLDVETQVLLLRIMERQFRLTNKEKRDDTKVMGEYYKLLDRYADTLAKSKNVKRAAMPPANTQHWLELGLDTSKHPEVVMYKIRWFGGTWSQWYVPGFNDRERDKGRDIRMWSCFNDHEYEVITTSAKEKQRDIKDLP